MPEEVIDGCQIRSDGRVVWVNKPILIGRFSRMGVDVHVNGKCVADSCIPGPCRKKHWRQFQYLMMEHHNVDVPDRHMPDYLKD